MIKMNLYKPLWLPLLAAGLSLLLISNVATAQNDQDKSGEKKGKSRDQGSRPPASSGSSRRQYDSGSQSSPAQRTNSVRDNLGSSRQQQNRPDAAKTDRPARKLDNANQAGGDQPQPGEKKTPGTDPRSTTDPKKQSNDRIGQASERPTTPAPQPTLHTK